MIILRIKKGIDTITADTTEISADNILYSADNNYFNADSNQFKVIPREYPGEVVVEFYNENKDTSFTENVVPFYSDGFMIIAYTFSDYKEADSFEIRIRDAFTNNMVWRGKAFATDFDDLSEYKMITSTPNTNNKIKF